MKPVHLTHSHSNCAAVRELMDIVGSKWAMLIVGMLAKRPQRFSELKREIGDITQKSLTATLRELEKDGIVKRTLTPVMPPRVDYALTALGVSLLEPVNALAMWAVANHPAVEKARARFAAAGRLRKIG
ncbi:MAG: helix-turn-helix domain-containing protein [Hyphomonadaceae bacterium]